MACCNVGMMPCHMVVGFAVCATMLTPCHVLAQSQSWTLRESAPKQLQMLYFDSFRNHVVGFEQLPGAVWLLRQGVPQPAWVQQQLAPLFALQLPLSLLVGYDEARREGILVTTSNQFPPGARTYRWVGGEWQLAATSGGPQVSNAAVAYDRVASRLLVFGGASIQLGTPGADLYAWNGNAWSIVPASNPPLPRTNAAMAFDPLRNRLVVFGGRDQGYAPLGDTWEFDGTQWQQLPVAGPSPRSASMVYDPSTQRCVLIGGGSATQQPLADCWSWDGTQWQLRPALPVGTVGHAWSSATGIHAVGLGGAVFDSFGGGAWTTRLPGDPGLQRYAPALAFDAARGEVVAAGGSPLGDTMAWNGRWRPVASAASGPGERIGAAMAPLGNELVLFGGTVPLYGLVADTWRWNGSSWSFALTNNFPPARNRHRMVYDGQRVLLFGGNGAFGPMDDLWAFDGLDWTQLVTATNPPARRDHGFAFDAQRQRAVLFGGGDTTGSLSDTWEWDGTQWTLRPAQQVPPAHFPDEIVYDAARGQVVAPRNGETWAWDGSNWTFVAFANGFDQDAAAMVYDSGGNRIVAHGRGGQTTVLAPIAQAVSITGWGCGGANELNVHGLVVPGEAPALYVGAAPSMVAALALGFAPAQVAWGGLCEQRVTVAASVFGVTDAFGSWSQPLPIPPLPALRGLEVHAQAAVLDGGPVSGVSLTRSVRLVVGD